MNKKNKFFLFVITLIMLWSLGGFFHIDQQGIEATFKKLPIIYSGIIFIILYVLVTFFLWFSKDIFKIVGAISFGAYFSTLLILIAETINAFILFYLARYLGRDFIETSLKANLKGLDKKISDIKFFWLFMFRAVPLIPFRFLDLACGLTKISFRKYLPAVILGSPLRIFWVQYVLSGPLRQSLFKPQALLNYDIFKDKIYLYLTLFFVALIIIVALKLKSKR